MTLAEGIRKHGLRKWYERELLQSHGHLALCILSVVGLLGVFEASAGSHTLTDRGLDIAAVLLCASVGLWSLRRYLGLLSRAESVANQAACPACKVYGRVELIEADATGNEVRVRCRACSHHWHISG